MPKPGTKQPRKTVMDKISRDVSVNSWKSYLFFLTNYDLEIGLSRAKVVY
jgi:hypothetical protein